MNDVKHNFLRYLILLAILFSGLLFFLLSAHNPRLQLRIIILVLFFYILWGVLHHYLDKTLTMLVFFEYLLMAVVAFTVIFSLLKFA